MDWPEDSDERAQLVVALQKAVVNSFAQGDWKELGYETGTIDWILGHRRLLRSLDFGDQDYGGCVFEALEMLRGTKPHSLDILLSKEQIRRRLRQDAPEIYVRYADGPAPVPDFEPRAFSPKEVIAKALANAQMLIASGDPTGALDRVHTALHGYLMTACEGHISPSDDAGITKLYKLLRENHPKLQKPGAGSEELDRILRAFSSILDALNPLRNRRSLAHPNESLVEADEAMLAINAARTILHYLDAKFRG